MLWLFPVCCVVLLPFSVIVSFAMTTSKWQYNIQMDSLFIRIQPSTRDLYMLETQYIVLYILHTCAIYL